jgi:hypothetical protein
MNPIINTLIGDNNSMDALTFYWVAEFEDDCIFQFENGIEHRFQEVKDRFNKLKYFTLQHKEKDLNFTVDLTLGIITFNTKPQAEELKEKKENIRLIYFRRNRVEISGSNLEISHIIIYFLGFQYNDKFGNNRQLVLQIDEKGNWIAGE